MTAPRIRPATVDDLEELCRLRLAFLADLQHVDPGEFAPEFIDATRAFFVDTMAQGRVHSWLATDADSRNVGIVSVVIVDMPPRPQQLGAFEGYLINMYVAPEARSQGIGRSLLEVVLDAADELGVRGFFLHHTPEGLPLYLSVGFTPDPRILTRPNDGIPIV